MKCNLTGLGWVPGLWVWLKAAALALTASSVGLATTISPNRLAAEGIPRRLVYANPTPQTSLPDLPNFAAWSAYLEKALRDEVFRRDSVGISEAAIEVYVADDSAVTRQLLLLYRLLDRLNLQYRTGDYASSSRGVIRGKAVRFDAGVWPQTYFDLRDSLLQWRSPHSPSPIDVRVQETPYSPRTGIDSALWFVEQMRSAPMKEKEAFETYASRHVLPQLRVIEQTRYGQGGLQVILQIGRLLGEAEIQAEKKHQNRFERHGFVKLFNRDLPFVQRMGHFEIMVWVALALGLINTFAILLFLFWRWRARRIS